MRQDHGSPAAGQSVGAIFRDNFIIVLNEILQVRGHENLGPAGPGCFQHMPVFRVVDRRTYAPGVAAKPPTRRRTLERAKDELRKQFGRDDPSWDRPGARRTRALFWVWVIAPSDAPPRDGSAARQKFVLPGAFAMLQPWPVAGVEKGCVMELRTVPAPSAPGDSAVLRLVLETALDGVIVIGGDGVVVDWNRQAEVVFGWRRDEAVGQLLAELVIPEPLRDAHRAGLSRFNLTGEAPLLGRRIEVTAIRRSGETFPIELSISPVNTDAATLFLGFVRDISERRRNEDLLKRQAREAELLHHVTSLAAETQSFDEILQLCLNSVCELTGWPAGHAYLPQRGDPPRLAPTAIWHGDLNEFAALKAATEASAFLAGDGLPGRIWSTREPVWISDIGKHGAFPRARPAGNLGVRSAFGFPIVSAGDVTAILEFFSRDAAQPDVRLLHIVRVLGEQVGRVLERRAEQRRQSLLLAELDHRAKNMLAVVTSMADQTARRAESLTTFRSAFTARLGSLARGYGLITAGQWRTTSLEAIARATLEPYVTEDGAQIDMHGDPVVLPPKAALALTMVLHELLSNAIKHGALASPLGRICLDWATEASPSRTIRLQWRETGLTGVTRPTRRGFGTKLIEASARRELGGDVSVTFAPGGVHYRFEFPDQTAGAAA